MVQQKMTPRGVVQAVAALAALGLLAGCDAPAPAGPTEWHEPAIITAPGEGPPDARPGACYGKDVTPAVIEVVTERVEVAPAQFGTDGTIIAPATYETTQTQRVVEPRREIFFEVPCPNLLTEEFIASLQRALQVRGFYDGPINGQMDDATHEAIRTFQQDQDPPTWILTMESARKLGLVAIDRDTL